MRQEGLTDLDPKQIVREGYDRIAPAYARAALSHASRARQRLTDQLVSELPPGSQVLDLGCGSGIPTASALARHFHVTGVDISPRQVELARRNVPSATFLTGDMAEVRFPAATFDAVVAFYSLIHVPREEHLGILRNVAGWLKPGGLLVATMGSGAVADGYEDDWLGAPMYWSHFDAAANRRLLDEAGLDVISAEEETEDEDGRPVTFLWVVARRR